MKTEVLEDDFGNKKDRPQIGFYLNNKEEKDKLEELADSYGLGKSALLRMIMIRDWKRMKKEKSEGNLQ